MAHDNKNRPLKVGDRITVPATITALDATSVTLTPLAVPKGMEEYATLINLEARLLYRCGPGDNNGLDDWILEDVEQHVTNLVRAETESRQAKFQGLRDEAQAAHDARVATMDAEYATQAAGHASRLEEATKAHEAKLADAQAAHDARVAGLDKNFNTILAYHTARLNALAVAPPPAPPTAAPSEG